MTKKPPGLLISFDGVDCSGKETQTRLLVNRLQRHGQTVLELQTPDYTTPSGMDLKRRLQNKDGEWTNMPWEEKMRLFATNRQEHREEVLAALERGDIVIYDRYVPSSLAFMAIEASHAQDADLKRAEVHKIVQQWEYEENQMPHEDLSIFLDVPPTISSRLLEKRKHRLGDEDEYTDHVVLQNRLYNEYDFMCANDPQRFARIQCVLGGEMLGIADVAELVWEAVAVNFPNLNTHA